MILIQFVVITIVTIVVIYNAHSIIAYGYFNYCTGVALGSPHCMFALELMVHCAHAAKNFWMYLGLVCASLFIYSLNFMINEINIIKTKLDKL